MVDLTSNHRNLVDSIAVNYGESETCHQFSIRPCDDPQYMESAGIIKHNKEHVTGFSIFCCGSTNTMAVDNQNDEFQGAHIATGSGRAVPSLQTSMFCFSPPPKRPDQKISWAVAAIRTLGRTTVSPCSSSLRPPLPPDFMKQMEVSENGGTSRYHPF